MTTGGWSCSASVHRLVGRKRGFSASHGKMCCGSCGEPCDGACTGLLRGEDVRDVRACCCAARKPPRFSLTGLRPPSRRSPRRNPPVSDPGQLVQYGWTEAVCESFTHDSTPARITRVDRGICDAITSSDQLRVRSGRFDLCTGDWVAVADGMVVDLVPRRTAIMRAAVSGRAESQALARRRRRLRPHRADARTRLGKRRAADRHPHEIRCGRTCPRTRWRRCRRSRQAALCLRSA